MSDDFEMTLMKTRMTLVYLSFVGWVGVTLALLMPLVLISTADDIYRDQLLFPLWIIGGVIGVVMGIVLLVYQIKRLVSKVGIFFIIVGLCSLTGAAYVYFGNVLEPEQPILLPPPTIQSTQSN